VTALDFPQNETTSFWVGTEEGSVYQANRYDRAGSKAGLNQSEIYRAHSAPVTGLHFHPSSGGSGPVDFSDLFLTCSVDWTVKLWRTKAGRTGGGGASGKASSSSASQSLPPIYSFEESDDYVYDVRWHPVHPAQFATADGSGKFDLWNLNVDTEVSNLTPFCLRLRHGNVGSRRIYHCGNGPSD
jgi:dynein intermediate chain